MMIVKETVYAYNFGRTNSIRILLKRQIQCRINRERCTILLYDRCAVHGHDDFDPT